MYWRNTRLLAADFLRRQRTQHSVRQANWSPHSAGKSVVDNPLKFAKKNSGIFCSVQGLMHCTCWIPCRSAHRTGWKAQTTRWRASTTSGRRCRSCGRRPRRRRTSSTPTASRSKPRWPRKHPDAPVHRRSLYRDPKHDDHSSRPASQTGVISIGQANNSHQEEGGG